MELCKAIPKKPFVSEDENICEEEINLIPQDISIGANVYVSDN